MKKSFWIPFICMLWIFVTCVIYNLWQFLCITIIPISFVLACTELYLEGVFDED